MDIDDRQIFGIVVARIYVIEFQKRGLPHAHILLFIDKKDAPTTEEKIDRVISAEIPDPVTQPKLHAIILRSMIHGPCGIINNPNSPCMDGGVCTISFPKEFKESTLLNSAGYPTYRRKNDGKTYVVRNHKVDNTWVVPYNPYLCLKYDAHINLEFCASITSVKYIFKYVYKGHDCANIQLRTGEQEGEAIHWDEIRSYVDTRYVSAPEACWRIFKFPMTYRSHSITRLAIHLPNEQPVCFLPGQEERAAAVAAERDTMLTAWFKLNQACPEARQYLYREIPHHFYFKQASRRWIKRKRRMNVIGRIYTVGVRQIERHCLRLLLINVPGATSFDYLKTVDGRTFRTFKEAAIARNLLADDAAWETVMAEAVVFQMPLPLRRLFANICIYGNPTNALALFENNVQHLSEDFTRLGHEPDVAKNLALKSIQDLLRFNGKTNEDFGLPVPDFQLIEQIVAAEPTANQERSRQEARLKGDVMKAQLNTGQKKAFDAIMGAIQNANSPQRKFYLDGPGGTGKTFTYNTLINVLKGLSKSSYNATTTGISAILVDDAGTFHSKYKIYPPITETSTSRIEDHDYLAEMIRQASVIVIDEVTMMVSHALNAIDKLLREIMKNNLPFGGKSFYLAAISGSFFQSSSTETESK